MATATLKWTLPTTRVDGSALAPGDVALVDVLDSGVTIASIAAASEFTTDTLAPGDHSFTVVVQDSGGRRSDPSNAAVVKVPDVVPVTANPSPVADLSATLNP